MILRSWIIVILGVCVSLSAQCQHRLSQQQPVSVSSVDAVFADSAVSSIPSETVSLHSPQKALLLSLLPGAGQVYNRQAWKIPIIYGILGGLTYWSITKYGDMKACRDEYLLRVNGGSPSMQKYLNYSDASVYNLYVSNNQSFQLSIVLGVVAYGLNLLDAFVYGHLFDFQIDDNISLRLEPAVLPDVSSYSVAPGFGLTMSL
ncbi:MAG: hypothetical protein KBT04_07975 [Bacteroidales bacterium]|nr:hypothetical protein [Candidatus Colimorpha onthohippi]